MYTNLKAKRWINQFHNFHQIPLFSCGMHYRKFLSLSDIPLLFPEDGISIPCSYSSYLTPVLAHKLHASIEECKDKDKASNTDTYLFFFTKTCTFKSSFTFRLVIVSWNIRISFVPLFYSTPEGILSGSL